MTRYVFIYFLIMARVLIFISRARVALYVKKILVSKKFLFNNVLECTTIEITRSKQKNIVYIELLVKMMQFLENNVNSLSARMSCGFKLQIGK